MPRLGLYAGKGSMYDAPAAAEGFGLKMQRLETTYKN